MLTFSWYYCFIGRGTTTLPLSTLVRVTSAYVLSANHFQIRLLRLFVNGSRPFFTASNTHLLRILRLMISSDTYEYYRQISTQKGWWLTISTNEVQSKEDASSFSTSSTDEKILSIVWNISSSHRPKRDSNTNWESVDERRELHWE